jgi:hypothetical protein
MKKQILEELKDMRYLFNYDRGKIISEQEQPLKCICGSFSMIKKICSWMMKMKKMKILII